MNSTEYVIASPADRADLIDFANYVFSQAHRPHNFKTLLPKVYADGAIDHSVHYLAKQGHCIRAMVAMLPQRMRLLDRTISAGCVGTVSVHPYARGEGHMKKLMAMMAEDAAARNLDLLVLGGQRQRYNYFGFEQAGVTLRYRIDATNVRHCLKDVDISDVSFEALSEDKPEGLDFAYALSAKLPAACERPRNELLAMLHSWNNDALLIRIGGEPAGYVSGQIAEIVLTDEALLPKVIKAFMAELGLTEIQIGVSPHQTQRMEILSRLCGQRTIGHTEMIRVLNWKNVLDACLRLKASYMRLEDGRLALEIDGKSVVITVENGVPSVTCEGCAPDLTLTGLEAERLLFDMERALCPDPRLRNWAPLPFPMSSVDTF